MGSEIKTSQESELAERLEKIENKLDLISSKSTAYGLDTSEIRSDEIDLHELWSILWQGKWWIISITLLFALAGALYALSLPNMYKSEGVYASAQKDNGGGALGGQIGGLAAIAGISLGGGKTNDIEQAMALIVSWPFLDMVVESNDLKPLVLGVKGWDSTVGELLWDEDLYNINQAEWVREPPPGKDVEPSSFEVYRALKEMIDVRFDVSKGLLTISVEHYSPEVAEQWVNLIVQEVNLSFQLRDTKEAKKNIDYLEEKIQQTRIAEMKAVFYGMIEAQMQTLMLAEVGRDYLISTVISPKAAEIKSKPSRALIVLFSAFFGGFLAVVVVIGLGAYSR